MKNYIPHSLEKSLTSVSPSRAYMLYGARQGRKNLSPEAYAGESKCWVADGRNHGRGTFIDTQQDLIDFLKAYKVIVIDEAQYVDGIGQSIRMIDQHSE